jgi:hypothetical protein
VSEKAKTASRRTRCRDEGGMWHGDPLNVCVYEDFISMDPDAMKCECEWTGKNEAKECECEIKDNGDVVGDADIFTLSFESGVELERV